MVIWSWVVINSVSSIHFAVWLGYWEIGFNNFLVSTLGGFRCTWVYGGELRYIPCDVYYHPRSSPSFWWTVLPVAMVLGYVPWLHPLWISLSNYNNVSSLMDRYKLRRQCITQGSRPDLPLAGCIGHHIIHYGFYHLLLIFVSRIKQNTNNSASFLSTNHFAISVILFSLLYYFGFF